MADWAVTPDTVGSVTDRTSWWVEVPTTVFPSQTGWWEVTAQLLAPLVGSATAAMIAPTFTAGARPAAEPMAATAELLPPSQFLVAFTIPAVASAAASMPTPTVAGAATVTATAMTATGAVKKPTYNINYGSGSGGFPYTFDFELDSTGAPDAFDYTFDFALG